MGHTDSIRLRFALIDEGKGLRDLYNKLKDLGINSKSFEDGRDTDDKNIIASNYWNLIQKHGINMDRVKVQRITPNKTYFQRHRKPERSGQCHTVTCHVEDEVINPYEARIVTPREAARLQSFPDWYEFYGPSIIFHGKSERSQTEQIGNAVPPLLAYAIAKAIKEVFLNDTKGSKINLRNDWKPLNNQK
jgi:site-specific DNA-cytosine methylase